MYLFPFFLKLYLEIARNKRGKEKLPITPLKIVNSRLLYLPQLRSYALLLNLILRRVLYCLLVLLGPAELAGL
jgi:hypothetical protein